MGYYTKFDISNNKEDVADAIVEQSGYSWDYREMEGKWYDWQEHIKQVSKKFPGVVIKVEGEGEENGHIWKAYAKDGKLQVCTAQITFEEYDESKLS